jgi:Spirocyclase AveC-like
MGLTLRTSSRTDRPAPASPPAKPGRLSPRAKRRALLWVMFIVALGAAVLGPAKTGPAGDQRLINPTPHGAVTIGGVPRSEPGFLGVANWPLVFSLLFVIVAAAVVLPMAWKSWRRRRLSHALLVFFCVAVLCSVDPPANWVTFTVYDPRFLHFPTTWPYIRLAPSVEPVVVIPGYPFYYFSIALIALWLFRRVILPRTRPQSWLRRHPILGALAVGLVVGLAWDVPTELFMIRARMYTYSQSFGPVLRVGPVHSGLPIVWSFLTMFSIAAVTAVLWQDDDGNSLLTTVAKRLPRLGPTSAMTSHWRQFIAGVLVLWMATLVPLTLNGAIRVSGLAHTPFKGNWPYQEIKTYDPYGTLHNHGKPGPYYK